MKRMFFILGAVASLQAAAQTDTTAYVTDTATLATPDATTTITTDTTFMHTSVQPEVKKATSIKNYPKNVLKFNIGSLLLFKNYNVTVERALTRRISATAGYRTMGTTQVSRLPALKQGYYLGGNDQSDVEDDWGAMRASNKTISAGFRVYAGRKPGPRGFYAGVYGRYARFNVDYDYEYETNAKTYTIPIRTTSKGLGGGVYMGVQWLIGKRIALDWELLGGHWGKLTGDGGGAADLSEISSLEKRFIRAEIEEKVPYPGKNKFVIADVSDTGAKVKIDGPFLGVRSGISLGIAF